MNGVLHVKGRAAVKPDAGRVGSLEDDVFAEPRSRLLELGLTDEQMNTRTGMGSRQIARWMGRDVQAEDTVLAKYAVGALSETGVMAVLYGVDSPQHHAGTANIPDPAPAPAVVPAATIDSLVAAMDPMARRATDPTFGKVHPWLSNHPDDDPFNSPQDSFEAGFAAGLRQPGDTRVFAWKYEWAPKGNWNGGLVNGRQCRDELLKDWGKMSDGQRAQLNVFLDADTPVVHNPSPSALDRSVKALVRKQLIELVPSPARTAWSARLTQKGRALQAALEPADTTDHRSRG